MNGPKVFLNIDLFGLTRFFTIICKKCILLLNPWPRILLYFNITP